MRAKVNKIETRKRDKKKETIQRINKTKTWFFEKIIKIEKPLANLIKMRKEKTQINKIRNKKKR
jgi:hypothetical protein